MLSTILYMIKKQFRVAATDADTVLYIFAIFFCYASLSS